MLRLLSAAIALPASICLAMARALAFCAAVAWPILSI